MNDSDIPELNKTKKGETKKCICLEKNEDSNNNNNRKNEEKSKLNKQDHDMINSKGTLINNIKKSF